MKKNTIAAVLFLVGMMLYACLLAKQETDAELKKYCDGVHSLAHGDYKKIYESDCKRFEP